MTWNWVVEISYYFVTYSLLRRMLTSYPAYFPTVLIWISRSWLHHFCYFHIFRWGLHVILDWSICSWHWWMDHQAHATCAPHLQCIYSNFCFFLQIKTNRHSRRQSSYDILVLGNMHLDSLPHQSRSRFTILFTVIPSSQWFSLLYQVYIYFSWFFSMPSMQLCCLVILVAGMNPCMVECWNSVLPQNLTNSPCKGWKRIFLEYSKWW